MTKSPSNTKTDNRSDKAEQRLYWADNQFAIFPDNPGQDMYRSLGLSRGYPPDNPWI